MRVLRRTALAATLCALAPLSAAAFDGGSQASESETLPRPDPGTEARELARDSIEKLMRAMELLLDSIPQYEAPEITENGDIIIRRKQDSDDPPSELPDPDADRREI